MDLTTNEPCIKKMQENCLFFRRLKEEYNGLDYSFKKWDIATLLSDLAVEVQNKFRRVGYIYSIITLQCN